jgi:hypothetical protein
MIKCNEDCGATKDDVTQAEDAGWFLPVARIFRCIACQRTMAEAGRLVGQGQPTADQLPPDSRGALPKATGHTITPPSVRG